LRDYQIFKKKKKKKGSLLNQQLSAITNIYITKYGAIKIGLFIFVIGCKLKKEDEYISSKTFLRMA